MKKVVKFKKRKQIFFFPIRLYCKNDLSTDYVLWLGFKLRTLKTTLHFSDILHVNLNLTSFMSHADYSDFRYQFYNMLTNIMY